MKRMAIIVVLGGLSVGPVWAVDPPCDVYPPAKQSRCMEIWKDLYHEDGPVIAQFGLDQLKRREEGQITAEQHLAQNMDFIKQSTQKRLARLNERMAKE
jgi:hypothetical protein